MRLVGLGVADRRQHRELARSVKALERRSLRVPAQPRVLGKGGSVQRRERERGPQRAVDRIGDRGEHRERVDAAVEEDRDEHPVVGAGRLGDPRLEVAEPQARGAVDGEHRRAGAKQEGAPVEAGAGGHGHSALDRRQAAARLGGCAPEHVGAAELRAVVAVPGHQLLSTSAGRGRSRSASGARSGAGRGRRSAPSRRSPPPAPSASRRRALSASAR